MKRCMSMCCVCAMALGLSFGVSTDTQAASSVNVTTDHSLQKMQNLLAIIKKLPEAKIF